MKRIILSVNASRATEFETNFWHDYAAACKKNDFIFYDLVFRKQPPIPNSVQEVHPARMTDLGRKFEKFDQRARPPWLTDDMIELHVDWEARRWGIPRSAIVTDGIIRTAAYVDHLIDSLQPCLVITTNKIDHPNRFAYLAAKSRGILYRFAERSPFESYIWESDGMFQEGTFLDRARRVYHQNVQPSILSKPMPPASKEGIEYLSKNPEGFRKTEASYSKMIKKDNRKTYVLFLDNVLWTGWSQENHPQGNIDYPVFRNLIDFIAILSDTVIDRLSGRLIVKPHPSCKEFISLQTRFPRIEVSQDAISHLVQVSDVIITGLTKLAYYALAQKKPVVALGGGMLSGLDATYDVNFESDLEKKLSEAVSKKNWGNKQRSFNYMLPFISSQFIRNGEEAFQSTMIQLDRFPYEQRSADFMGKVATGSEIDALSYRVQILFDVTRLFNDHMHHSGISRYIRLLYKELVKMPELDIVPVISGGFSSTSEHESFILQLLGREVKHLKREVSRSREFGEPVIYHSPINPIPEYLDRTDIRCIITIHDIFHLTEDCYSENRKNYITEKVVNSINPEVDFIFFDSDFSRKQFEDFVDIDKSYSRVVHLAADPLFSSDALLNYDGANREESLIVFYQNDPRKNFDRSFNLACKWALKDGGGKTVYVVGRGDGLSQYKARASSEVNGKIKFVFLENPTDDELKSVYKRGKYFVYMSKAEGFGLPPLEALSCGCFPILLNNTALSEVYAGWPLVFDDHNSDADILATMHRLFDDEYRLSRLLIAARSVLRRYSWRSTAALTWQGYLAVYRQAKFGEHVHARIDHKPLLWNGASGGDIATTIVPVRMVTENESGLTPPQSPLSRPWYAPVGDALRRLVPGLFPALQTTRRALWRLAASSLVWLAGLGALGVIGVAAFAPGPLASRLVLAGAALGVIVILGLGALGWRLRRALKTLSAENRRLASDIAHIHELAAGREGRVDRLLDDQDGLVRRMSRFEGVQSDGARALEARIAELKGEIARTGLAAREGAEAALRKDLSRLEARIGELKGEIARTGQAARQGAEAALRKDLSRLEDRFAGLASTEAAALREEISGLQAALEQKIKARAASTGASFGRAAQAARRREAALQEQIDSLQAALNQITGETEAARSAAAEGDEALRAEQTRLEDELNETLSQLEARLTAADGETASALRAELSGLREQAEGALAAREGAETDLRAGMADLQERLAGIQARHEQALLDHKEALSGHEKRALDHADAGIEALRAELKAVREGLEQRLRAEVDEATDEALTRRDGKLQQQIDALAERLESATGGAARELRDEIGRLQQALKTAEALATSVRETASAGDEALREELEAVRKASAETGEALQKSLNSVSTRLSTTESHSVSLHVTSALRALRPLWTGGSAVQALKEQAEVEHGHELLMAVLADEEKASPGKLAGKTLIEIGTTRENVPSQASTQKLGVFSALTGLRFITVDMDPANTSAARNILRYINPGAQALTQKGETYLRQHPAPLEYVYLDAFDFDHGKHSEQRQASYRKYLGTEISDPACWKMHEDCAETIIARMVKDGIVVLDDTWTDEEGRYAGKGKLAAPLLMENGFKVIARTRRTLALRRSG